MKKKYSLVLVLAGLMTFSSLVGCQHGSSNIASTDTGSSTSAISGEVDTFNFTATAPATINKGETANITITEQNANPSITRVYGFSSSNTNVATVSENGVISALSKGEAKITVSESVSKKRQQITVNVIEAELANGGYNYASLAGDEAIQTRTEILGKLEEYAMDKHLTGITLFENGGFVKFARRVQLPTTEYITGYGFGTVYEGTLNADMEKETNTAHKRYYHQATSSDPGTINARNDTGSQVSDLESYIASQYWDTKMNSTKNRYVWYPVLAKDKITIDGVQKDFDRPIPIFNNAEVKPNEDPNPLGLYKTWRIYVKTGAEDGLQFRYNGAAWPGHTFDYRPVTIEDYEFAYYFLLTGSHKFKRGREAANDQTYGIRGAQAYYYKTENNKTDQESKDVWNDMKSKGQIGISTGHGTNGYYIDITLINAIDRFTAMYQLSSRLYSPIPEEFISTIGVSGDNAIIKGAKRYGTFMDATELGSHSGKIMDMTINVGPYFLEEWYTGQSMTFKRNETYNEAGRYNIQGLKLIVIDTSNDTDAIYNAFKDGLVDQCTIPSKHLKEEDGQDNVHQTRGDSTFKLNVNSCTQQTWNELFGVGGKINPAGSNWTVKPWMSNDNFLNGLFYSIDRTQFATARGSRPSINYFADSYLSDPEKGISYNDSQAHKDAIAKFDIKDKQGNSLYGYSYDRAVLSFKAAVDELVAAGAFKKGTKTNPTKIGITITWMYETDKTEYGVEIKSYFEKAFNDNAVSDGTVKLVVTNEAVKNWQDVYNEVMMLGQFDLAFGAISGNTYNPLNFLEVLKSDNSSTFTLNWGTDTNAVDPVKPIVYDNKIWSFDALWACADHGGVVENGRSIKPVKKAFMTYPKNNFNDGVTFTITTNFFKDDAGTVDYAIDYVSLFIFGGATYELETTTTADGKISVTITEEQAHAIRDEIIRAKKLCDPNKPQNQWITDPFKVDNYNVYWNIDVHYLLSIKDPKTGEMGTPSENYVTIAKNEASWTDKQEV